MATVLLSFVSTVCILLKLAIFGGVTAVVPVTGTVFWRPCDVMLDRSELLRLGRRNTIASKQYGMVGICEMAVQKNFMWLLVYIRDHMSQRLN